MSHVARTLIQMKATLKFKIAIETFCKLSLHLTSLNKFSFQLSHIRDVKIYFGDIFIRPTMTAAFTSVLQCSGDCKTELLFFAVNEILCCIVDNFYNVRQNLYRRY
jgi:hypothetical protein